jgi:uncharacterized protein YbbK (DUF523 family)
MSRFEDTGFHPFVVPVCRDGGYGETLLKKTCLVSACLAGLCTRYDGKSKPDPACLALLESMEWLPICPEQLGGLPTPRTPADIVDGDGQDVLAGKAAVIDRNGVDVSTRFILGARQTLAVARARNIELALLKSGSPSCGVSGRPGVTAALLLQHGIDCREFG